MQHRVTVVLFRRAGSAYSGYLFVDGSSREQLLGEVSYKMICGGILQTLKYLGRNPYYVKLPFAKDLKWIKRDGSALDVKKYEGSEYAVFTLTV